MRLTEAERDELVELLKQAKKTFAKAKNEALAHRCGMFLQRLGGVVSLFPCGEASEMIEFKKFQDHVNSLPIVEVWVDGKFKAIVCPNETEKGIRVISRCFKGEPMCEPREDAPDIVEWEFKLVE